MSYEVKMKKNSNFWCLTKCTCLYYFYLKKIEKVILALRANDPQQDSILILFMEGIVLLMFIMPGEKQMVTWWRGYLVVVSQDNKQLQRPAVG